MELLTHEIHRVVSLVTDIHQFIPNSKVVDAYKTMIFSLNTVDDAILLKGSWAMVRKEGVAFIGSYVQLRSELMMFDESTVN